MDKINIKVNESDIRLDQFLVDKYPKLSRSKIQHLIKNNHIVIDGFDAKPSLKLHGGEIISGEIIEIGNTEIIPQKIDLDIIYEDDDIAVINKASGIVVHPGNGNYQNTIVNGLAYHFNTLSSKDKSRPGIIHRLDKDTSGILIVAKNNFSHDFISSQFANREVYKEYEALVWGEVESSGSIDGLIGRDRKKRTLFTMVDKNGKFSKSDYYFIKSYNPISHVKLVPSTGRTHQLRVHMKVIGHPIFCDTVYNGGGNNIKSYDNIFSKKLTHALKRLNRVALHASKIEFILPSTNSKIAFEADMPKDILSTMEILKNE